MVRKAIKPITYDTIIRGTNDYMPVTFLRQVWVDPETGEELEEPIYVPYDLTGRIAVLTVKSVAYDGLNPAAQLNGKEAHDAPILEKWKSQLRDETGPINDVDRTLNPTESPWNRDFMFRVTVDCDDNTEGASGPKDNRYQWQNNYQGMYGADPKEGRVVFRITKKMTMVRPGVYYFDVRLMEKDLKQIGMIRECRDWAPIFGQLEIQGTPTNRTAVFDWIEMEGENNG